MTLHFGGPQIAVVAINVGLGMVVVAVDGKRPAAQVGRIIGIALEMVLLYCGGFFSGARP